MTGRRRRIDCREAFDRLYGYLDGELTPTQEAEVREHLDACRHCFRLARFESAYLRFLKARTRAQRAPPELRKRILRSLLTSGDMG
jgi:anti-sigma factor (TIGR02949 family)